VSELHFKKTKDLSTTLDLSHAWHDTVISPL